MLLVTLCLLPVNLADAQDIETIVFPALKALYASTDGGSWNNSSGWDTNGIPTAAELSNWHGITFSNGILEKIDLNKNNLVGTIPGVIGDLVNLKLLYFGQNRLKGTLPSELSNLANLEALLAHSSDLSGELPEWLGDLPKLNSIVLNDNAFTGQVPSSISNLTGLVGLML